MANKRVSELNELLNTQVAANDLFLIIDVSAIESKKIRASELQTFSLNGTASYALQALTSSYALQARSASWSPSVISASYALSASYADFARTASYALSVLSASYALSSSWAFQCVSASYSLTSSVQLVVSSGLSDQAKSASYLIYVAGFNNGTSSAAISASWALKATSSDFLNYTTGTPNGTASYAMSASNAVSASLLNYFGIPNGTASYALISATAALANSASTSTLLSHAAFFREYDIVTSSIVNSSTTASFGWLTVSSSNGTPIVSVDVWGDVLVPISNTPQGSGSLQLLFESFYGNRLTDTATYLYYYTGSSLQQTGSMICPFNLKGKFPLATVNERISASVLAWNGITIYTGSRGVKMLPRATTDIFVDE